MSSARLRSAVRERERSETGAPLREVYHPFGRPCDAPRSYSEYPSRALCEYSEYLSGVLCEYSEYRVGAYHPFGRPTAPQGTTRGAARALLRRQSSRVLWVLTGYPGYSKDALLRGQSSGTRGALTRHGLRGTLGSRWGPTAVRGTPGTHAAGGGATAVRGTPGTHAAGGGLRPSGVLWVLTQSGLDLRQ